jgi:ATP-dependent Clp protease protease subunit
MLPTAPRNLNPSLQFGRSSNSTSQTTSTINTASKLNPQDSLSIKHQKRFWDTPSVELTEMNTSDIAADPLSTSSDILRHLTLQQVLHPNQTGRIKLHLNSISSEPSAVFELSDMLSLLEKPIDAVITSSSGKAGLSILTHPNVRSFMMPQSTLVFPPESDGVSFLPQKNNSIQTERWLRDVSHEHLTYNVSEKAGKFDQKEFSNMLKAKDGQKSLTSLEALNFGEKGLINAILVGNNDQIITRPDLDKFLKEKKQQGWTSKDIQQFLHDGYRAGEIPSRQLRSVFPDSLPLHSQESKINLKPQLFTRSIYTKGLNRGELAPEKPYQLPLDCQVAETSKHGVPSYIVKNLKNPPTSILQNQALFFTDSIDHESINRSLQALKHFDKERIKSDSKNHIPLFLNSPGGDASFAAPLYMNTIQRLKTPIDIIVTGLAASAAAMLILPSTTGKRFALPGAMMMLHEGSMKAKAKDVSEDMKKTEESERRKLSQETGRKYQDIRRDSLNDYWISSLEAMFYGDKGLIDGIMVGPKHIITRQDVTDYLKEKLGSLDAVNAKVKERLERRRDMNRETDHEFDTNDPFDNVFKTIHDVAKRKSKVLGQDPEFKHSGPDSQSTSFELIPIKAYKPFGVSFPGISIIGD